MQPAADSDSIASSTPPAGSPPGSPASISPPREGQNTSRERKSGLSCAECRRSKLRCDRTVPCQACIRRGCAKLCPNGTMAATKGNKALQVRAQKLGQQVTSMTAKIKELEDALAAAHLQIRQPASEPPEETHSTHKSLVGTRRRSYGTGTGSLALDDEGRARYYGDTAASEFLTGLIPKGGLHNLCYTPNFDTHNLGSLPAEIIMLYNAFPFGLRHRPYSNSLFLPFMPPRNKALDIAQIYFDRFACTYNPITFEDFNETLMRPIYGQSNMPRIDAIHPHRLSLFLGIMAVGTAHSGGNVAAVMNPAAERFLILACAALSLSPILAEAMTATVQALYMINGYLFTSTRVGCEEGWILIGIMARIGDRIGLHRDGAQFNLSPMELKRRRLIFWELYKSDAWLSFITGRSPAINLAHVDTKFPDTEEDPRMMGYPAWKFRYAAACLWPTLTLATADAASYEDTMALDRKIRTFPVPARLQVTLQSSEVWSWSSDPSKAVQQFSVVCDRELNLLFLHRNYVAVALRDENPLAHQFGASVLAAYRGATRMCFALRDLYRMHAPAVGQVWSFWSGLFSSCIILAAIPIMKPQCSLAQSALMNFKAACRLYDEGAASVRHPNMVEILTKLEQRAESSFVSYWASPINYKCVPPPPGEIDELSLLGGLETVIAAPGSEGSSPSLSHVRPAAQLSHMRTQHEQISIHPHGHSPDLDVFPPLDAPSHVPQQPAFSQTYGGMSFGGCEFDFPADSIDMLFDPVPNFEQIMCPPDSHSSAYSAQPLQHQHLYQAEPAFQNMVGWDQPVQMGEDFAVRENIWGSFIGELMNTSTSASYTQYGL